MKKKTCVALLFALLITAISLVGLALSPTPAVAEFCLPKTRWVLAGCCGSHQKIKQQEGLCCEFTGCRNWTDTGATQCTATCGGV